MWCVINVKGGENSNIINVLFDNVKKRCIFTDNITQDVIYETTTLRGNEIIMFLKKLTEKYNIENIEIKTIDDDAKEYDGGVR